MEQQLEDDILDAVQSGDIATVKKFLDEGVPVDLTDEEGWSLLHHAAALGQIKVVNLLREKGCRVDLIDDEGRTPLHYAATNGDTETIRLLIMMGSNVNLVDNKGNTPLKWSIMCEQNTAIEELTKQGGTVDIEEIEPSTDNLDRPALLLPFQDPGHILGDRNNEVCQSNQPELTTDIQHVSTAAKSNDSYKHSDHNSHQTDFVTTNQCMDTNADTTQLEGDIFEAAQCGDTATVKGYLDLGVPVDVSDEDGWSPVHHAIAHRQVEVIRLLMDRGCLMNPVKNRKQATKSSDLHITTEGGGKYSSYTYNTRIRETVDVVEVEPLLLSFQDPGQILGDGKSEVCQSSQTELSTDIQHVETAVKFNDSCKHSDHNSHQTDLVTTQQCMDTNADTTQLEGDIFEAAQCGDTATVKGYLDLGVPVDVSDEDGWSPVHHAIAHRQVEVIRLLMDRGCLMNPVKNRKHATKSSDLHITTEGGGKYSSYTYDTRIRETVDVVEVEPLLLSFQDPGQILGDGKSEVCQSSQTELSTDIQHVETAVKFNDSCKHSDHNSHQTDLVTTQQCMDTNADTTQLEGDIFEAAQCGDTATVKGYLDLGVPVDITGEDGWSPVHYAIAHRQVEVIRLLMDRGCLMNPVKNRKQATKSSDLHITTEGGSKYSTYNTKELHEDVFEAARCGDTATIQSYLNSGGPVDLTDEDGRTLLHCTAGEGQIKVVELLTERSIRALHFAATTGDIHRNEMLAEQGFDVNEGDGKGGTHLHYVALHFAAARGQVDLVRTMLSSGGRESMTKVAGTLGTPLHLAVGRGHKDVVSLLLKEGCPINVVDSEGRSVLHIAAQCGQIHMIEMLAEQGLGVNRGDDEGGTPLHYAAAIGQLKSVHTLLRLGGSESMTKVAGEYGTPLHLAVRNGHEDIVSLLLNCSINLEDSEFKGILHYAAQCGQIHMIKVFSKKGLDVNIVNDEGLTPLHTAAAYGQLKTVLTLLSLGGRKSMRKVAGAYGTPLHQAVVGGHKDIVLLLLNEGCRINDVNCEGKSVLHSAAQHGQTHMIELLEGQELDVNIGDDKGRTPLHYAAICGQLESVHTLLRLGGRKSMGKVAGAYGTPLHLAVGIGHKDIVSLLLNEGCPINVVDSEGRSVLHIAARFGRKETIFKKLVTVGNGGNIHILDRFGMKFSDVILIRYNFKVIKQFCVACDLKCDDESPLGVISALHDNELLDINRILCLAAVRGDVSIFDAMITSPYPLNEQKMPKIAIFLSVRSGERKLPDQFYVSEEPLNPLHISILSKYFSISQNTKFIDKLTSHPRTRYTVNELFPNGLSPLDVARRFELHDIAVIIERAGGGPGAWADLPKEIEDKTIDLFTSLKELKGREFGEKATSNILSMLGYQVVEDAEKFLEERPVLHLLDEQFLLHIKNKGKWKRVGRLLKVDEDTLKRISEETTDDDDTYHSMLEYWLEHGHNVSWKTLLDAVGRFETKKTVDDIADKIVEELAPSQVSIQIGSFHFKLQRCVVLHIYTTT